MKKIFKIEMERALCGYGLKISLAIGFIICIVHYIRNVIPFVIDPLIFYKVNTTTVPASVFNSWIAGGINYEYELYIRLIPLLATIPYGITFYSDTRSGIVKNYYTRLKKRYYLIAKYIAVFVSGGVAVTIPLLVNLLATAAVLPSIVWPNGSFPINANGMWSSLFYSSPYLYVFLYLCLQFVCAGCIATVALIISSWVGNMFVVMLFPYILCEFLNSVLRLDSVIFIRAIAPYRLFSISQITPNYAVSYIIFIVAAFILGFLFYYLKGVKDETI